ncbi:MAG: hypothetical protein FJ255_06160 [Phycisphaerae bacterium]|nr:hypothetical protein [Phycisphaerae bacterium]
MPGSWEIPNPWRLQYFGPFANGSGAVRVIHAALWYNPEFGAACRVLGFEQGLFVRWETPTVYLWNPASAPLTGDVPQYFTVVPNRRTNLFCAGHAHLGDGSVLFANGQFWEIGAEGSNQPCTRNSDIFNVAQPEWNVPNPPGYVQLPRWYPTLVREGAGDVFVFSGLRRNIAPRGYVRPVEVFRAAARAYELLPAPADLPLDQEPYGFFYLCPNGPVFFAGGESKTAWLSRPTTSGQYTWLATEPNDEHEEYWHCTSVMYEPGLVLKIGGARDGRRGRRDGQGLLHRRARGVQPAAAPAASGAAGVGPARAVGADPEHVAAAARDQDERDGAPAARGERGGGGRESPPGAGRP